MKIDSLNSTGGIAPGTTRVKPKSAPDIGAAKTTGDDVKLSAPTVSGGGEPVNAARVQEIRQAIAEGRFQINADAIADRLIESARELLQAQHKA